MASSSIFWRCFISLVKFWDCSNFQVNIITDFGVMTIFFHKGLTRNPEIGNTAFWVLSNILRQGRVRDTKFDTDVWCYWMLQNARDTASTISALLRENQQEEWVKLPPPPLHTPRLGLKSLWIVFSNNMSVAQEEIEIHSIHLYLIW